MNTHLDVKLTPPDGTWNTARKLIEVVAKDATLKNLNIANIDIEVDGVFSEDKKTKTVGINNAFSNIPSQHVNIGGAL